MPDKRQPVVILADHDGIGGQFGAAFAERHSLGYPLLSDPEGKVARQFGVNTRFGIIPVKRWTFVIDADGRVREVIKSGTNMRVHADRALEVLRQP